MKALQSATKIITGIVAVTPIGKALLMASVAIADKVDHGSATAYLGQTNSTLNMLPGGNLIQQVASVASDGKSNDVLNKIDPKKMAMNDAKTIGKTAITHPSSTLSVAKTVAHQNVQTVKQPLTSVFHSTASSAPASTLHAIVNKNPLPRPSMLAHILPPASIPVVHPPSTITKAIASLPASPPASIVPVSTLTKTVDKPVVAIQPIDVKPSIVSALVTATVEATPPPPPASTLTANTLTIITPVTTLATVESPSFFAMLFAMIFGK